MRRILPYILATLTQHNRVRVNIVWNKKEYVRNIFRFWELLFWRREGITKPVTVWYVRGGETGREYGTLEGRLAHYEMFVREYIKKLLSVRIYIPVVVTTTGIPIFISPYVFAISRNGSSVFTDLTALAVTSPSFTVSSGDVVIVMTFDGTANATNCTVNSVSTNHINGTSGTDGTGGNYFTDFFFQPSPSAGSQTATATGLGTIAIAVQVYSGAATTVPTGTQYKAAASSVTATGTSPSTTAWGLVCGACGPTATASTNVTFWASALGHAGQMYVGDSNGTTGTTGTYSQTVTATSPMQILQCFLQIAVAAPKSGFLAFM